jgi:putative ABC transport system permease protein
MWISSLKIALKQLRLHPFFSLFNLFIIAITVACVMIIVMRFEILIASKGEEKNLDRTLLMTRMEHRVGEMTNISALSLGFIENYVKKLKIPEHIAIKAEEQWHYPSQGKLKTHIIFGVSEDFFEIFDYDLIHGESLKENQIQNREMLALISKSVSLDVFKKLNVVGNSIELNGRNYIVQGIFEDVPESMRYAHASILIPYTTVAAWEGGNEFAGGYHAYLMHNDLSMIDEMKDEFIQLKENINNSIKGTIYTNPDTKLERTVKGYNQPSIDINVESEIGQVILVLFLFMLLPALNLSALNLSRYKNRIEELAIRRSFGARKTNISMQILWETVSITFIGGLVGILIALFVILKMSSVIFADIFFTVDLNIDLSDIPFTFNLIGIFLLTIIVFGLLSGLIPAVMANRNSPAINLKGGSR